MNTSARLFQATHHHHHHQRQPLIKFLGPRSFPSSAVSAATALHPGTTTTPSKPHPLAAMYGPTVEAAASSVASSPSSLSPSRAQSTQSTQTTTTTPTTQTQTTNQTTIVYYPSRSAMPKPYAYSTLSAEEMEAVEVGASG